MGALLTPNEVQPHLQFSPAVAEAEPRRALALMAELVQSRWAEAKGLRRRAANSRNGLRRQLQLSQSRLLIGRLTNSLVYQYDARVHRRGRQHETIV